MSRYPYYGPGFEPVGRMYEGTHAYKSEDSPMVGQISPEQAHAQARRAYSRFPGFEEVPAYYTVTILLPGNAGATLGNSTPIRPEPFVCERITWATSGDVYPAIVPAADAAGYSVQGRSVECSFGDEFTRFLGQQPALITTLFGDSNGYMDLPGKGILFQGRQALQVNLTRLFWPTTQPEIITRFDFQFQGVGLLPAGVAQSGSAG